MTELRIHGNTESWNNGITNLRMRGSRQENPAVKEPNLPNY